MIVLDASALIAYFDPSDAHHGRIQAQLTESDEPLAASVITLAETLVHPFRAGRLNEAQQLLERLEVRPIGIDGPETGLLAQLRAETGLPMPDCCVIQAADRVHASTVISFDDRLTRVAAARGLATA
jgi:predicted nucleic acid-binding protein